MNLNINKLKKDKLISGTKSVKYYLGTCQSNNLAEIKISCSLHSHLLNNLKILFARERSEHEIKISARNIDKNTKDFLVINRILKNPDPFKKFFSDGAEIFYGLFENKRNIIVKIFDSENQGKKEYTISEYLYNKGYDEFGKYICIFSCLDDINKYSKIDTKKYLCDKDGKVKITSLLMDEYPLGSIKDYKWTKDNFEILKNLLKQTVNIILKIAKDLGFLHRDLHTGNIMITQYLTGYYPIIIDLELSMFVNNEEINKDYKYRGEDKLEKLVAYDLIRLFHSVGFIRDIQSGFITDNIKKMASHGATFEFLYDIINMIDNIQIV